MSCSSKIVNYPGAIVYPNETINLQHHSRWIVLLNGCDKFDLFKVRYNVCTSKFDAFRVSRAQMRALGVTLVIKDELTERKFTLDPFGKDVWRLSSLGGHARHGQKKDGCGCKDFCVVKVDRDKVTSAPADDDCGCSRPPSCGCGC